jgi:hypothetical protein
MRKQMNERDTIQELLYQIGRLAHDMGEQWRIEHPTLMDVYQACFIERKTVMLNQCNTGDDRPPQPTTQSIIQSIIDTYTGPTGGWTASPKEVKEALLKQFKD